MSRRGRTLMEGLDIATLASSGLIERVNEFFGHPTPVEVHESGVPAALRNGSVRANLADRFRPPVALCSVATTRRWWAG